MTRHIGIAHAHARNIGYGRMGVDLMAALSKLGIQTYDWTEGWERHVTPVDTIHSPGRPKTVVFVSPGTHIKGWFKGQRAIAYTMWEATELPEANRELLHEFDQIIVPSKANLELYSRYHPNVSYVPLGVGPEWHFRPRDPLFYENDLDADGDLRMPMTAPSFRFMCAGTSPRRKGIDITAQAFQRAFPNREAMSPRPELIYKSPLGVRVDGVTQHVEGYLSDADEIELYEGVHCFVSAARGEGFGLQPLQAMAMGIPTILVDAHGHESFAHYGIPIGAKLVPAPEEMGFGEAGEWWEADLDSLVENMRWVYENYAQHEARAAKLAPIVHREFAWDETARLLLEAIGSEHLTEMERWVPLGNDYFGNPQWHALEPMKYLIRVTAPYQGTVNGVAYHYEPGMDYYDVADVKRQIARMGYLHPSCIGADGVVNADPRFSGSHAYCPTCGQRLNSQPTKADDILAGLEG